MKYNLLMVTYLLTINSVNDLPLINFQQDISINEDCGGESCNGDNKLVLSLDNFDTDDVENPDDLVLYIDQDNIGDDYSTDGSLGIFFNAMSTRCSDITQASARLSEKI